MASQDWLTFPALGALPHRFILRHPTLPMDVDRAEALDRLAPWHADIIANTGSGNLRTAEQVHGDKLAIVDSASPAQTLLADGLLTQDPTVVLGIYVADCCAVYLHDTATSSIGLVHAGKKGAELGIVPHAIEQMRTAFGADPATLTVQLSPCIRPPAYDVDFAALIRSQCRDAGIAAANLHDCGICTSSDLSRYYSYRIEKGRTGRMLALLALR